VREKTNRFANYYDSQRCGLLEPGSRSRGSIRHRRDQGHRGTPAHRYFGEVSLVLDILYKFQDSPPVCRNVDHDLADKGPYVSRVTMLAK
jgi:hypothetical protein